jgi:hypothetical protein
MPDLRIILTPQPFQVAVLVVRVNLEPLAKYFACRFIVNSTSSHFILSALAFLPSHLPSMYLDSTFWSWIEIYSP